MARRSAIQKLLFFVRWQLVPLALALPTHFAFVLRGISGHRAGLRPRLRLALRAALIHLRVESGHNPGELLPIMEEIIELPPDVPGNITECGAYLGSSSAKLSLAAKQAGRTLMVCDSFEGLPETQASDDPFFQRGQYAGRLEVVRRHVAKFGALDAVRFVAGWFDDTLPSLRGTPIACAFWDVDLQHSFRSCIRELWPGVAPGAKVFIHDVNRAAVVSVFTDALWWSREMGTAPPPLSGALTGLGRSAPHLGYVVKPG